jgi:hypothetical protein
MHRKFGIAKVGDWKYDLDQLTARHRSGLVVEFIIADQGFTVRVEKLGALTEDERVKRVQEAAHFFATATGGTVDQTPAILEVPTDWEWPLIAFDPATGTVALPALFVEKVAALYDKKREELRDDYLSGFLLTWYDQRRKDGAPQDPVMEDIIRHHQRLRWVGQDTRDIR